MKKEHVLVVEDDEDTRSAVVALLESAGHAVIEARHGAEALQHLRGGAPIGLIVLDLWMPIMNGWEFRAEQLKDPALAAVPVVVMTADAGAGRTAGSIGAVEWINKPFAFDRLLAIVARHC